MFDFDDMDDAEAASTQAAAETAAEEVEASTQAASPAEAIVADGEQDHTETVAACDPVVDAPTEDASQTVADGQSPDKVSTPPIADEEAEVSVPARAEESQAEVAVAEAESNAPQCGDANASSDGIEAAPHQTWSDGVEAQAASVPVDDGQTNTADKGDEADAKDVTALLSDLLEQCRIELGQQIEDMRHAYKVLDTRQVERKAIEDKIKDRMTWVKRKQEDVRKRLVSLSEDLENVDQSTTQWEVRPQPAPSLEERFEQHRSQHQRW